MLVLLLILWPIAELFVIIEVARAIGVLLTVILLFIAWPIGAWALRSQGRAVWRRLSVAVAEGRAPAREVLDGALVLVGGVLLMIPGFITDVIGAAALLPPTRAVLRSSLRRNFQSRFVARTVRFTQRRAYDVDSTAHDVDSPRLHS
jgi:UPF0716 protein FxsA